MVSNFQSDMSVLLEVRGGVRGPLRVRRYVALPEPGNGRAQRGVTGRIIGLDTCDYSCESSRVSSIRLFILGALADEGEMHGHQLRQLAEKEHVDMWTDISVGALYGAFKRLAAEELIEEVRTEREGDYPERQVWRITDAGRESLAPTARRGLSEIVIRPTRSTSPSPASTS